MKPGSVWVNPKFALQDGSPVRVHICLDCHNEIGGNEQQCAKCGCEHFITQTKTSFKKPVLAENVFKNNDFLQQLQQSGYKPCRVPDYKGDFCKHFYEKIFYDDHGHKYAIHAYGSLYSDPFTDGLSWEFELYDNNKERSVKITAYNWQKGQNLTDVEQFFENMWIALGCNYYEIY